MSQKTLEQSHELSVVRKFIKDVKIQMGWGESKKPKYELLRSEINLYKEKFNRDFVLPEGTVIIEDVE